jgi:hypothetical protein
MKGMGASCTVSRRGVMFSVASARPTGLEVKSARSTNKKGEAEKIPAMFIGFLDHNGNGPMGAGRVPALYMFDFNGIEWAQ